MQISLHKANKRVSKTDHPLQYLSTLTEAYLAATATSLRGLLGGNRFQELPNLSDIKVTMVNVILLNNFFSLPVSFIGKILREDIKGYICYNKQF